MANVPGDLDHLVFAVPELDAAVASLQSRLGVRAAAGGSHPGRGTRNAIVALGPASYLEIAAPDPAQAEATFTRPRWLGVDETAAPRLTRWAIRATEIERRLDAARRAGLRLGTLRAGSRRAPDGRSLEWRLTDPEEGDAPGIVPFLIDWGSSPHPARAALRSAAAVRLSSFRLEHPDPAEIGQLLRTLSLEVRIDRANTAALVATLETPRGLVQLR